MLKKYYEQYDYAGTMQPRCYYIPFADKSEWREFREDSSRFASLNGKWTIAPYKKRSGRPGRLLCSDARKTDRRSVVRAVLRHGLFSVHQC